MRKRINNKKRKRIYIFNKSSQKNLTNSQVLRVNHSDKDIQLILIKNLKNLINTLNLNNTKTNCIRLYISYKNIELPSLKMTISLDKLSNSYSEIIKTVLIKYKNNIVKNSEISKIGISLTQI